MKFTAFLISFLLMLQSVAHGQKKPALSIQHITGDYYMYTTYGKLDDGSVYPSNSLYIVTQKGVLMIDVPWDTTQTRPLLDSIEKKHHKKVIACISTHFHKDRTAGLDILKAQGIKTYACAKTVAFCKQKMEQVPEFTIVSDTTFNFGNHTAQTFYPGKGHTSDNIVVWFPDAKLLYGGCFVKSVEATSLGNLEDASPKEWPESMRKVTVKCNGVKYVIPGHDGGISPKSLDHTLDLLKKYNSKHK
jgi:metallo-beta-lactamase class B